MVEHLQLTSRVIFFSMMSLQVLYDHYIKGLVILKNKKDLRKYYLSVRQNLLPQRVSEASQQVEKLFFRLKEVEEAQKILLYHSFRNEIRTEGIMRELLERNKEVYLPITKPELKQLVPGRVVDPSKDLFPGNMGIMEPRIETDLENVDLDIVVVPGLVFNKKGYRLGYGGGYYDRFLAEAPETLLKIGLTYEELLVEELPLDEHDIPVEIIITDQGIYNTGSGLNEPF